MCISLFLLITSVPLCIRMLLESQYKEEITQLYDVDHSVIPKHAYKKGSSSLEFQYKKSKIKVQIANIHGEIRGSESGYKRLGDIHIFVNSKHFDTLSKRILVKEYVENPFDVASISDDLSIFELTNHQSGKKILIIIEDIGNFIIKTEADRGYYKEGSLEEQKYRLYLIDDQGRIKKQEFGYEGKRTKLQTYLAQQISTTKFGHYTDLLDAYVSIIVPFMYPIFSALLGLCLLPFTITIKEK